MPLLGNALQFVIHVADEIAGANRKQLMKIKTHDEENERGETDDYPIDELRGTKIIPSVNSSLCL